jgi:hypothetical protein
LPFTVTRMSVTDVGRSDRVAGRPVERSGAVAGCRTLEAVGPEVRLPGAACPTVVLLGPSARWLEGAAPFAAGAAGAEPLLDAAEVTGAVAPADATGLPGEEGVTDTGAAGGWTEGVEAPT